MSVRAETRLWLAQRASAAVLAICVAVHLATIISAVHAQLTAADILGRTRGSVAWALFYGVFVLVTSAYAKLSDWPGGGLAGIHGTNQPSLLGQAVSHGCVRVSNRIASALERLAPLGTPVDLLP